MATAATRMRIFISYRREDSAGSAGRLHDTLAKQFGCTVKEIYWTQGQYDVVTIVDAPDDASATALAMSAGKLGNVRTQTLRAFTAAELAPILDKVS